MSIVDAVIANLGASTKTKAAILGTSVTMKGSLFDQGLKDLGIEVLRPEQADITAFTDLLNTYFYSGQAEEGLAELVVYVRSVFGASEDLLCILACTDLAPAFPDKIGQITFDAEGLTFFDATTAHIDAILTAASSAPDEARVGGG